VDIAYHFIVDPAGRVWEGRSLRLIGAHAGNQEMNSGNIGILVLGTFDLQTPTPRQEESLLKLVEGLRIVWEIDWRQVLTHDEVRREAGDVGTECPGKHLDELVKNYREDRAASTDSSSAAIRDSDP
jgi:N-acetyl-anhydromuramyl-L-alanine amidase AmpD